MGSVYNKEAKARTARIRVEGNNSTSYSRRLDLSERPETTSIIQKLDVRRKSQGS